MKCHVIRDTHRGLGAVASVAAQSLTTWALNAAREDKKERERIAFKALQDEAKLVDKMIAKGLVTKDADGNVSEASIKEAKKGLNDVLVALATRYEIDL